MESWGSINSSFERNEKVDRELIHSCVDWGIRNGGGKGTCTTTAEDPVRSACVERRDAAVDARESGGKDVREGE